MDLDWCLRCERRFDGQGPYCSAHCQSLSRADPYLPSPSQSEESYELELDDLAPDDDDDDDHLDLDIHQHHHAPAPLDLHRWHGKHAAGILAWARDVPAHSPPNLLPIRPDPPSSSTAASICTRAASSPLSAATQTFPRPELLRRHTTQPLPPSLYVSKPRLAAPRAPTPTVPLRTPSPVSGTTTCASSLAAISTSAPPPHTHALARPSVLHDLAHRVRAWVPALQRHGSTLALLSSSPAPTPAVDDLRAHRRKVLGAMDSTTTLVGGADALLTVEKKAAAAAAAWLYDEHSDAEEEDGLVVRLPGRARRARTAVVLPTTALS